MDMSTITYTTQTTRVGALLPMPSCLGIGGTQWGPGKGHPRYIGAVTTGGRGWPDTNATNAMSRCNDAITQALQNTSPSEKHGSGAGDQQEVTIYQPFQKTVEVLQTTDRDDDPASDESERDD